MPSVPVKAPHPAPATTVSSLQPKKVDLSAAKKALLSKAFDPKVPTKEQPKITVTFNKEVASRGKLYEANSTHDLPLDEAHSLAAHIVK